LTVNDRLIAENLNQLYGNAPKHALALLDCCVSRDIGRGLLTVPEVWDSGVSLLEVAQLVVTYAGDLLRLDSGQTIYRPSFIVNGLKDILEYVVIDVSTLSSTLAAFTDMVQKGQEDSGSLDLTLCNAIFGNYDHLLRESIIHEPRLVTANADDDW